MNFTILPEDFDLNYPEINKYLIQIHSQNKFVPLEIKGVKETCGSFEAPNQHTAKGVLKWVKEKFPQIMFVLYEGNTMCSLKQIVKI